EKITSFFFQAEDGIRDGHVTGVQTCALPIFRRDSEPLGAGKTAFVRGLAEGLGITPDEVSSPTFTLIQEYRGGRLPLFHVDLYRLNDAREIDDLGLDEIGEDGVIAIEWAEKLARRIEQAIEVHITHADADIRTITVR